MPGEEDMKSHEGNTNYKAITCEQIPELFLDKIVAKKHFSKYGKIKRFILRPKRLSCTVEYETKEDAKNAFLNGGNYNGIDFVVSYAEHEVAHVQNTEEWVDPEVQAELDAMSPGHRVDATLRTAALYNTNGIGKIPKSNTNSFSCSPKPTKSQLPQPEIPKIYNVARQELEAILKSASFTCEEKYRVLDARDKLIRLTTVRQTDIKKAVAIKGTCPDMCPEKERLMREFQRQVSIFETAEEENSESTISHKKAVKEYSRSSADQEVPLPHELRPESVLQMTMLYLVHRVMALCDDSKTSLCDWFHFVWDRTRSIRKDITQQELCSLGAVQLVEQCARFHIHCAARLVAEDPSVFDKKINAENLTKCLQTLKYMYHDLRIKKVICPCEAEFRSYIILLNLGDSNFLWEVKQLPETIQRSVEIKQAIAFYNALQNNNFVRFFSMIKSSSTSYLSACILLGYFTKLRVRAMDAIIKSHNWRKNDVYLPLSYLSSVLAFEDESSAVSFFNHYGLHCDVSENRVLLDRLIKPNVEYVMERALQLVESKRQVSVGECVFGQKLPSAYLFENHQPQNSFDDNGMFKLELLPPDSRLIEAFPKAKSQSKPQRERSDTNIISNNQVNLFKIPQTFSVISPKQQRKQIQPEHNIAKEMQETPFEPLVIKKEENISSPDGFKFCESTFAAAASTNKKSEDNYNTFFHTKSLSTTEKPLPNFKSNFEGVSINAQAESENIFGIAVRETAKLFQRHKDETKGTFSHAYPLKKLEESVKNSTFPIISSESTFDSLEKNVEINKILENEVIDNRSIMERNCVKEDIQQEKYENFNKSEKTKRQESREREANELKIILDEKALHTTELFVFEQVEEEVISIAKAEHLLSQTIMHASDLQKDILITEVVSDLVKDVANEEYAYMCYDQLLLNLYFNKWLMHLRKKKKQRKLLESTPLWVTTSTRAEHAQAIKHPCQQKNMELIKRYRFGQSCDFNTYLKTEYDNICNGNEKPINLFALVGQHLLAKKNFTSCGLLEQRKYFKFLITLPENKEELLGFESLSNKWLMSVIEKSQIKSGPFVNGIEHDVALCVRKLNGIMPKNEQGEAMTTEGDHNDGVVCFITGVEIDTHSRKRLYNLLKLTKNLKRIPLAVIAYNCNCNNEELSELLGLDILQEEGLIHSYIILGSQIKKSNLNLRKLFINAVDFITRKSCSLNSSEIQALAMQNLLSLLEAALGEEVWQRWCCSAKRNPVFNKICNIPEHVVGIYHKALEHLLHITQEDFDEMPEFPVELKEFVPEVSCSTEPLEIEFFPANWKEKTGKNLIKNFLQSLYLPDIKKVPVDIENFKLWLFKYTAKCIADDDFAAAKASHEAITNLVSQVNVEGLQNAEFSSCMRMINYLPVFKPIIFAHINRMLKHSKKALINLNVIYLKDDLKNYQTQPWWLNYEPLNLVSIDYSQVPLNLSQTIELGNKHSSVTDNIGKIIAEAEETSRKVDEIIYKCKQKKLRNLSSTSELKRTLDDSLYHFELSKKVGRYDTSLITNLTHDIDKSINKVLNQLSTPKQKRKVFCLETSNQHSDIKHVIDRATKLIHNIECLEDKKIKIK